MIICLAHLFYIHPTPGIEPGLHMKCYLPVCAADIEPEEQSYTDGEPVENRLLFRTERAALVESDN